MESESKDRHGHDRQTSEPQKIVHSLYQQKGQQHQLGVGLHGNEGGLISPSFVPRLLSFGPSPLQYNNGNNNHMEEKQQRGRSEEGLVSCALSKLECSNINHNSPQTMTSNNTNIQSDVMNTAENSPTTAVDKALLKSNKRDELTSISNDRKIRNPFTSPPLTTRKQSKRGRGSMGSIQLESSPPLPQLPSPPPHLPLQVGSTTMDNPLYNTNKETITNEFFVMTDYDPDSSSSSSSSSSSVGKNHHILDMGELDTMLDEAMGGVVGVGNKTSANTDNILNGKSSRDNGNSISDCESSSASSANPKHVESLLNCDSSVSNNSDEISPDEAVVESRDPLFSVESELNRLEVSNNSNDLSSLLSEGSEEDDDNDNGGRFIARNQQGQHNYHDRMVPFDLKSENDLSLASTITTSDYKTVYQPKKGDNNLSQSTTRSATASLNDMLVRLRFSDSHRQYGPNDESRSRASDIEEEDEFIGLLNDNIANLGKFQVDDRNWSRVESTKEKQQAGSSSKENEGDDKENIIYSNNKELIPLGSNALVTLPPNLERILQSSNTSSISYSADQRLASSQKQQRKKKSCRTKKKRQSYGSNDTVQQILRISSSSSSCNFASMSQLEEILNENGEDALEEALLAPMKYRNHRQDESLVPGTDHHGRSSRRHRRHQDDTSITKSNIPDAIITRGLPPSNAEDNPNAILDCNEEYGISISSDPYINTITSSKGNWGEQSNILKETVGDIGNVDANCGVESEHDLSTVRSPYSCPPHSSNSSTSINNCDDNYSVNIQSYDKFKNTEIKYLRANLKSALIALKSVRAERRDIEIMGEGLQKEVQEKDGLIDELLKDLDKVEGRQHDRLDLFQKELTEYQDKQVGNNTAAMVKKKGSGGDMMLPSPYSASYNMASLNKSIDSDHSLLVEVKGLQNFVLRKDEILLDVYRQDLQLYRKRNEHLEACRLRSRQEVHHLKERNKDFTQMSVALQDAMNKLAVAELELEDRDYQIERMQMEKASIIAQPQKKESSCTTGSSKQNNSKESSLMEMELELKQSTINGHLVTIRQLESKLSTIDSTVILGEEETRKLQDQLTKSTNQCKEIPKIENRLEEAINEKINVKVELRKMQLDGEMKDSDYRLSLAGLQLEGVEKSMAQLQDESQGNAKLVEQVEIIQAELKVANCKERQYKIHFEQKEDELTQALRMVNDKDSDAKKKDALLNEIRAKLSTVETELEHSEKKVEELSIKWRESEKKFIECLGNVQADLEEAKNKGEKVQSQLEEKDNDLLRMSEKNELKLKEIETKLSTADKKVQSSESILKELQEELLENKEAAKHGVTIQAELDKVNDEVDRVQLQLKRKENEMTKLQGTIVKKDCKIEEIEAKFRLAEMELASSEDQSKILQKKLEESEEVAEHVGTIQNVQKEMYSEVKRVRLRLELKENEVTKLLWSVDNLRSNLEQRDSKILVLQDQLDVSKNQNKAIELRINAYTSLKEIELTKRDSKIEELSKSFKEISTQNKELLVVKDHCQDMRAKLQIKEEQSHKSHQVIESLESTLIGQKEESEKNKCCIKSLEKELDEIMKQKEDTMEQIILLKSDVKEFRNVSTENSKTISQLEEESACKGLRVQEISNESNQFQQQLIDQTNAYEQVKAELKIVKSQLVAVEAEQVEEEKLTTSHMCEIDDLKKQVERIKECVKGKDSKMEEHLKTISELEIQSALKESQLLEISNMSDQWKQQMLDQKKENEQVKTMLNVATSKVAAIEAEQTEREKMSAFYLCEIDDLKLQVGNKQDYIQEMETEIKDYKERLKQSKKQNKCLDEMLEKMRVTQSEHGKNIDALILQGDTVLTTEQPESNTFDSKIQQFHLQQSEKEGLEHKDILGDTINNIRNTEKDLHKKREFICLQLVNANEPQDRLKTSQDELIKIDKEAHMPEVSMNGNGTRTSNSLKEDTKFLVKEKSNMAQLVEELQATLCNQKEDQLEHSEKQRVELRVILDRAMNRVITTDIEVSDIEEAIAIDNLQSDINEGKIELKKKDKEIEEIKVNERKNKVQLQQSERQRFELQVILDSTVEKLANVEKELDDKEGSVTKNLIIINELQSNTKRYEMDIKRKDKEISEFQKSQRDSMCNSKNEQLQHSKVKIEPCVMADSESKKLQVVEKGVNKEENKITTCPEIALEPKQKEPLLLEDENCTPKVDVDSELHLNEMARFVQDDLQKCYFSAELVDDLKIQVKMKDDSIVLISEELERSNLNLSKKEESIKEGINKIKDMKCSLQDAMWRIDELEEKLLLEQEVNDDLQIRLKDIENDMGQQARSEENNNNLNYPQGTTDSKVLLDIDYSNANCSLSTRSKEECAKPNNLSHDDKETMAKVDCTNRGHTINGNTCQNNFDQRAYSERITELEFILLNKEDESNQAMTDLITELDEVRAMRENSMKLLESTQNELEKAKETCKEFELEIFALESSLLAASTSNPTDQNGKEIGKSDESSCCNEESKVVIKELLFKLEILEKDKEELVIQNKKLCKSEMSQDDSCCSLISETKSCYQTIEPVSAAPKERPSTENSAIMCRFQEKKLVNDLKIAKEAVQWEIKRANAAEEKLHQIIFSLEDKELQLADITCQNTCLENEVDNANGRLSKLVLCVLEHNPASATKSITHSFVSHIESTDLLGLVEILESIFEMDSFDEGTLKWNSTKDLVASEANSPILSNLGCNHDVKGQEQEQEQVNNSLHVSSSSLSYSSEKNDVRSLSIDNSYEVEEQNQSFVKSLKSMMNQSSMIISNALEDFGIEDMHYNNSTYGNELYEFHPLSAESSKGIIRIDYDEYESMRQKCDMLEAERSELLEETSLLLNKSKALNDAENVAFLHDVEKNVAMERAQFLKETKDRILKVTQKMHDRYQKMNAFRLWQLRTCKCAFS